jgi:hypothetical protein
VPANKSASWSSDQDGVLRRWWGRKSASVIANMVGRSKNAVVGRVFRLGLSKPKGWKPLKWLPHKHAPAVRPKGYVMRPKVQPPKIMPTDIWNPLPGTTPVKLVDLEVNDCRWPVTGGSCGCYAEGTYCEVHRAIASTGSTGVKPTGIPRMERLSDISPL